MGAVHILESSGFFYFVLEKEPPNFQPVDLSTSVAVEDLPLSTISSIRYPFFIPPPAYSSYSRTLLVLGHRASI